VFETDKEVLDWYERQPARLSKEYVTAFAGMRSRTTRQSRVCPVLIYMRDIEYFTDMYYQELRRTPTGKDPIIRKFMDRWSIEELHHGNLLNRFLEEAGVRQGRTGKLKRRERFRVSTRSEVISWTTRRDRLENIFTARTWFGARSTRSRR
jgi:hypothetical protein